MRNFKTAAALAAAIGLAGAVGCDTGPGHRSGMVESPTVRIVASNTDVVTGEITTFTVRSTNTVGRDAEIKWEKTGGELDEEDNGRVARVRFDRPGAYTVTAHLVVDGRVVDSDSATVEVRPLR